MDSEFPSRNAIRLDTKLQFENTSRVGRDLISPALTGKPMVVSPAVEFVAGPNKTVVIWV